MSKETLKIQDILFKPILVKIDKTETVFFPFEINNTKNTFINSKQELESRDIYNVLAWNITETFAESEPIIENIRIEDFNKYFKNIRLLTIDELNEKINIDSGIQFIISGIGQMLSEVDTLRKILNSLQYYNLGEKSKDANLVITNENTGIAHLVFNCINGNDTLKKKEMEKIGEVINDIISEKRDFNTDDQKEIEKLKHELEYKVIEALPAKFRAGDFNLNMDEIIDIIKKSDHGEEVNE